jgi:hypothetical protein
VAHDGALNICDERDPEVPVGAEPVDEPRLDIGGERCQMNGVDGALVASVFGADVHGVPLSVSFP